MAKPKKNSYSLTRMWFDFAFDNQSKVKPQHGIIYLWAVESNNRCGWVDEFGFPSQHTMKATGIRTWSTYTNALNDLIDWGFIDMRERSKNQHSANIIHLVFNSQKPSKTLDISRLNEEVAYALKEEAKDSAYALKEKATTKATSKRPLKRLKYIETSKQVNNKQEDVVEVELDSDGNPIKWYKWFCESWIANSLEHKRKKSYLRTLSRSSQENLKVILKDFTEEDVKKAIVGLMIQRSFPNQQEFANEPTHLLKDEGVYIGKYLAAYESNDREIYGKIKKFE